jgi:hypothetical protein
MIDKIFMATNTVIFFLWLIMIFAPYARFTKNFFNSIWLWISGGFLYISMILTYGSGIDWVSISRPTYEGITFLLSQPEVAAIAWIHLIIFDLFTGRWILMDLDKTNHHQFIHVPFMFLTLMAGPFGLASYLLYRRIARKKKFIVVS